MQNSKFKIINLCNKIIEYGFYLLFILVPLIFTPFNFELFEFNKIWVVYLLTIIITASWLIKMISEEKIEFKRTPLDIPLLLFLAVNLLSTIFSIDVHTSIWGYYSRFNGGLLSITSYILLYFAFVNNFKSAQVKRLLTFSLMAGFFVALFGIMEHFGIDEKYWVQDVRNRVFSTLGQPNWLAAYVSVLIPIAISFGLGCLKPKTKLDTKIESRNWKIDISRKIFLTSIFYFLLSILFYLVLLYTKSRSGFLGLWAGLIFFFAIYLWQRKRILNWYLLVVLVFIGSITFLVGSPFEQLNKFTLSNFLRTPNSKLQTGPVLETGLPADATALQAGGTESGEIRKIVWQGALDIARANPFFGTGVETFAFAYYKFRPAAHNLTSEWDYLYNKAHNEYLNYLATTGFLGLAAYLGIIFTFLVLCIKYYVLSIKGKIHNTSYLLLFTSLVAAYLSILVSNFFGFSVTLINLYFFLIPAMVFILTDQLKSQQVLAFPIPKTIKQFHQFQRLLTIILLIVSSYLLVALVLFWLADVDYATGYNLSRGGQIEKGFQYLRSATNKRGGEPVFKNELAINAAILATAFYTQEEATAAASLTNEAIAVSQEITKKNPNNITFWKDQTRLFYALSGMNEKYLSNAVSSLERARLLGPTDPRISYNLALLYAGTNQNEKAIKTLEETVKLKPNYRDAHYALGVFYDDNKEREKAILEMDYIIKNIASSDSQATEKLLEWRGY